MSAAPDSRRYPIRISRPELFLTAIAFIVAFTVFLVRTDYLPYVLDNNESFSAFVHGSNLNRFGLQGSFGLTDEAYGPDPAAHPYVYTHQGNFPRLYAALLHAIGIRSVEGQIVATTFSIGLGSILLIQALFTSIGGRLLGTLVAAAFISDYLLSAQWLVNTFKVWHGFLLYSLLYCAQQHRATGGRRWLAMICIASICVSYFDLMMAVFTYVFFGVYTLVTHGWSNRGSLAHAYLAATIGAVVSVSIFVTQLVAYYGWAGLREDVYLTFFGRNYVGTDPEAIRQWQQFFLSNRIVFWEALIDSSPVASVKFAAQAVFKYGFSLFTPYLTVLIVVVVLRSSVVSLAVSIAKFRSHFAQAAGAAFLLIGGARLLLGDIGIALVFPYLVALGLIRSTGGSPRPSAPVASAATSFLSWFGIHLALATICLTDAVEGWPGSMRMLGVSSSSLVVTVVIGLALTAATLTTWVANRSIAARVVWTSRDGANSLRRITAGVYGVILSVFLLGQSTAYGTVDPSQAAIWAHSLAPWSASGATKFFAALVASLGFLSMLRHGVHRSKGSCSSLSLAAYFAAGAAAYVAAYFFSPGYMVVINLNRYVPVLVFLLLPIVALALQDLLKTALQRRGGYLAGFGAMLAVVHFLAFWLGLQMTYWALFPADLAQSFKRLGQEPFRDTTFVVNSYAAPVAAKTGNWAYMDTLFVTSGDYRLTAGGYRPDGRDIYRWFADREDPRYDFPRFAFCYVMPTLDQAARRIALARRDFNPDGTSPAQHRTLPEGCGATFMVQSSGRDIGTPPKAVKVAGDDSPLNRWSIFRLEDDFPPYLATTSMNNGTQVKVSMSRGRGGCIAQVSYSFQQQQGKAESGSFMRAWIESGDSNTRNVQELHAGRPTQVLQIPHGFGGLLHVSIRPATETRIGETFRSGPVSVSGC